VLNNFGAGTAICSTIGSLLVVFILNNDFTVSLFNAEFLYFIYHSGRKLYYINEINPFFIFQTFSRN